MNINLLRLLPQQIYKKKLRTNRSILPAHNKRYYCRTTLKLSKAPKKIVLDSPAP